MFDLGLVLLKIINNEKYLHRIHKIARKKKCIPFKKFFFFKKPPKETTWAQKETAQPLLICGVCEPKACSWNHSSPGRAGAEIPDRQLSNWTKHTCEGLRAKRSDFCNEDFRFQEAICFSSPDSVNSGMDRQCGTWTRWSPLSRTQ